MAIYSLFRWDLGKYEIYQDSRPVPLMSDPIQCPAPRAYSQVGYDISSILCPLPADARYIGTSDLPQGQVVRPTNGYYAGVPQNRGSRTGSPNLGGMSGLGAPSHPQVPVQYIPPTSHRSAHLPRVGMPIITPDGGMGYAPSVEPGLGESVAAFSFGKAVIFNSLIGIASTVISTLIFKRAFNYEMGAHTTAAAASAPKPAMAESSGRKGRRKRRG